MSMLFDPMVKWPVVPTLSNKIEIFINDGVIFYGGTKGPFKLNGINSVKDTTELLRELIKNELPYADFIKMLSKKDNSANLFYILTTLHSNGYLADKNSVTLEKQYLDRLNQSVKNFSSVDEILKLKSNIKIKINVNNKYVFQKLSQLLLEADFILTEDENYDWQIFEIDEDSNLADLDENKKNIIFSNTEDSFILGPLVSKDAVRISELNFFKDKNFSDEISESSVYNIFLTVTKMVLKLKDLYLDRGLIKYTNFNAEYLSMVDIIGKENINILEKFEYLSAFSAPKYQNKANHLAHYRMGNIKLAEKKFVSDFWRETEFNAPKGLDSILTNLCGIKPGFKNKKMSPTGGNINSNLLFYINLSKDDLDGIGVYFYENIKNKMYQVDNNIDKLYSIIPSKHSVNGYLILASNVDYIEKKYYDFGFKIANLNTGVQIATLLSIKKPKEIKSLKFIENYDEKELSNIIGTSMNNIIFNAVLEVIK